MGIHNGLDRLDLGRLVDKNQLSYDLFLAQSDEITLHRNEQFIWIESADNSPVFKGVLETNVELHNSSPAISQFFKKLASGKDQFCWKVWSSSSPNNIGDILESQGLTVGSVNPGMAIDLSSCTFFKPPVDKLLVKKVDSNECLAQWIATLSDGFQLNQPLRATYRKVLMDGGFRDPVRLYLGLYDDEPVATACCYFEHDVVGIYWVSTLPAFRERGIGRCLMNIVLRDAYIAGYKFAILQASGEGFKMYKDIGFRQVCNNTRYEWKP